MFFKVFGQVQKVCNFKQVSLKLYSIIVFDCKAFIVIKSHIPPVQNSSTRITMIFEQIKSGDFPCPDALRKCSANGQTIVALELIEHK